MPAVCVGSHQQRTRVGLDHWIDGTFGIIRREGATIAIAPNGRSLSRHDLRRGFLDGLTELAGGIGGIDPLADHASGGPIWTDETTGACVLVYHGERFHGGDPHRFWSYLGLAVTFDLGNTFRDIGPVITVTRQDDDEQPPPIEIGSGGFTIRGDDMWLYFQDRRHAEIRINLAVARAPLDSIRSAAIGGPPPTFTKYRNGAFSEPGIGGAATDLLAGTSHPVMWYDVAEIHGSTVAAFSTVTKSDDGVWRWNHATATAADGLGFGPATLLYPHSFDEELLYLTIDSGSTDQRRIEHDWFHLYRLRGRSGDRWANADLERVTVRVSDRSGSREPTSAPAPANGA
jgi:hypothetical protein